MSRPRKTPGDRVVDRLKKDLAARLGVDDVKELSLDPDEVHRAELVKATVDQIAELEKIWESERERGRIMIPGSRGQDTLNPVIGELRAQRAFLDRLVSQFRWKGGATAGMSASEKARHAATARWSPEQAAQAMQLRWGPGGAG